MNKDTLVILWNSRFPKDRLYRKKYNIAFGSPQHRELNQIDIYFDLYEDKLFEKYGKQYVEDEEKRKIYAETGQFLRDIESDSKLMDDLFEKLDVSKLNKKVEDKSEEQDG